MNINSQKFKELLLKKRVTQKDLEETLDLPRTRIGVWLNRESIPNKYIDKVNKALEVDLESYFSGDGIDLIDELTPSTSGRIPFYDIDVFAGDVEIFNENSVVQPTAYYHLPNSIADFYVPVKGNSMAQKIEGGDEVGIKIITDKSFFVYGLEYFIITQDYRLCKQIRKHSDPKKVILHSYNKEFDDIELPINKILHLGSVVDIRKQNQ